MSTDRMRGVSRADGRDRRKEKKVESEKKKESRSFPIWNEESQREEIRRNGVRFKEVSTN